MVRLGANDHAIAALAARQGGVVSRAQLGAVGLSPAAVDQRVRRGRLHRVHHGVYAVGHPLLGTRGRWFAALLACPGSVLSHRSAGAVRDLVPVRAGSVELTVAGYGGRGRRAGLVVHRARLEDDEVTEHDGLAVTVPERTLLDLASVLGRPALEQAFVRASTLRLIDVGKLRRLLERSPHRHGAPTVRAILAEWAGGGAPARSVLEERFLALCHRADLPRPVVNARIAGYEVDFCWPAARLVVEIDGHAFHATPSALDRDRARDRALTLAGWHVLRFTWHDVTRRGAAVVDDVNRSLARSRTYRP
jgi:hypothetical protein